MIVAKIVKVIDSFTVVINKGKNEGVRKGQRFLIYELGEEIVDPDSGRNLGRLELVKGTGRVIHVQDEMATIKSDMEEDVGVRRIRKKVHQYPRESFWSMVVGSPVEEEIVEPRKEPKPFDSVYEGDYAKLIEE
ncbi:hypothetical protein [Desulfurobacterium sp.]